MHVKCYFLMQIDLHNFKESSDQLAKKGTMIDPTQRAWIEISGSSIKHNVTQIKGSLKENCRFMAVVKADAYGHDAEVVSRYAIEGGANELGVATMQEGINLRRAGINVPILVLGNLYTKEDLIVCFKYKLMPTISSLRECLLCNNIGKKFNKKFILHLKVDTGMSRLGFEECEFINKFPQIMSLEYISVKGIYSHFASADESNALSQNSFTQIQKRKFQAVLKKINVDRFPEICIHFANSAATLLSKEMHFDMVRVGLSMYGYDPIPKSEINLALKPALLLKARISFIRTIDKNVGVSYGRKFISDKKTKLAVVSIGYADGINRKLSNKISIICNNKFYSQVGSITMDQLMVNIHNDNHIKVGDSVLLLGSNGNLTVSPLDWAEKASSIPWEILCSFKNRLPRVQVP